VRAAPNGDAIAVVLSDDSWKTHIWLAGDGVSFRAFPSDEQRWIFDVLARDDGPLVVASGDDRGGAITVQERFPTGASETLPGSNGSDEPLLLDGGPLIFVVSELGAWRIHVLGWGDDRIATWDLPNFYYASARLTERGVEVIAPHFEEEGGSERYHHAEVAEGRPAALARLPKSLVGVTDFAFIGGNGEIYVAEGDALVEKTRGQARVLANHVAGSGPLRAHFQRQRGAAVFGERVFALGDGRAIDLGAVDRSAKADDDVLDVFPDRHGRALVLLKDGSLWRYAPGQARQRLFKTSLRPSP